MVLHHCSTSAFWVHPESPFQPLVISIFPDSSIPAVVSEFLRVEFRSSPLPNCMCCLLQMYHAHFSRMTCLQRLSKSRNTRLARIPVHSFVYLSACSFLFEFFLSLSSPFPASGIQLQPLQALIP